MSKKPIPGNFAPPSSGAGKVEGETLPRQVMQRWLKIREVAQVLNLSESMTYLLAQRPVDEGGLPSVRVGRSVRVPADRLEEWIARRLQGDRQDVGR